MPIGYSGRALWRAAGVEIGVASVVTVDWFGVGSYARQP